MIKKRLSLFLYVIIDLLLSAAATALSFAICGSYDILSSKEIFINIVSFPAIMFVALYIYRVYNILWEYSQFNDYLHIAASIFLSCAVVFFMNRVAYGDKLKVSYYFVLCVFSAIFICVPRYGVKHFNKNVLNKTSGSMSGNIMIIGAGSAGNTLINGMSANPDYKNCKIKCVIDDDYSKLGKYINGVQVAGNTSDIVDCAERYKIDVIIFAIPTCPNDRKSAILEICQKTNCKIKTVPSMYQLLANDDVSVGKIREIEIEDLLGREPFDKAIIGNIEYITDKTVMVTGAGGSIGSELCRQIASLSPKLLIILDIYENGAFDIQNELLRDYPELNIATLIASVRDSKRMHEIFKNHRPEIVFHAAAHKHVPLMENNPNEAVKNNVFGTYKTAKCADEFGASKFVLISTDKAVNPTNIMGASKRICEMIVQMFNTKSKTDFVAVRFGNVLGSNGSVIPTFKRQIAEGGPVTVTDPNIIRYFMTIPEAVSLVLQAGNSAKGGEIFVLDMGKPVKIVDLAEKLIKLSGYKPYTDIKIKFVGLRPGEKLYEEMLMSEEGLKKTDNSLIYIGRPIDFDEDRLMMLLTKLKDNMYDDSYDLRELVQEIVPTYQYSKEK